MKIYHGSIEKVEKLIGKQQLIAELKTYKLVDQYLFHTEAALQTLTFLEAKEVAK